MGDGPKDVACKKKAWDMLRDLCVQADVPEPNLWRHGSENKTASRALRVSVACSLILWGLEKARGTRNQGATKGQRGTTNCKQESGLQVTNLIVCSGRTRAVYPDNPGHCSGNVSGNSHRALFIQLCPGLQVSYKRICWKSSTGFVLTPGLFIWPWVITYASILGR